MSQRSTTSESADRRLAGVFAAIALIAACGGGGDAPAPPDHSTRDRQDVDTDRALRDTDVPSNDTESGSDTDQAPRFTEPPPYSGPDAEPGGPPGNGGSPSANGGTTGGGRAGMPAGGRAGMATGGRGSSTPVPPTCNTAEGCQCGDDLCLACECAYGEGAAICDSACE